MNQNNNPKKKKGQVWMIAAKKEPYVLLEKRVCNSVALWHVLRGKKIEIWEESEMKGDSFLSGAQ